MVPNYRTGKICYVELPAIDIARSAEFYRRAFGWSIRQHADGTTAFDDTTGEVSGMWVLARPPAAEPGIIVSIMVADIDAAAKAVTDAGGEIVLPADPNAREVFAHFRDPAGNVLGIYQESGLSEEE
ncbi:MAG TPA: VOC family protein [Candidatus Baltobacteraceae bacterium]|nr:VOC family protein [Candidatus Baltobacteraceae bacterium]